MSEKRITKAQKREEMSEGKEVERMEGVCWCRQGVTLAHMKHVSLQQESAMGHHPPHHPLEI